MQIFVFPMIFAMVIPSVETFLPSVGHVNMINIWKRPMMLYSKPIVGRSHRGQLRNGGSRLICQLRSGGPPMDNEPLDLSEETVKQALMEAKEVILRRFWSVLNWTWSAGFRNDFWQLGREPCDRDNRGHRTRRHWWSFCHCSTHWPVLAQESR